MADPQIENGYLKIAMEITEALARHRIPGQEMQLIWVLLRKTWGWNKKYDYISLSQFSKLSGIDRRKCSILIKSLVRKKIVKNTITHKGDRRPVSYGFNKNYEEWLLSPKKTSITQRDDRLSPKEMTKLSPKETHTIDTKKIIIQSSKDVIKYLNETYNRKFRFTEGNLKHIRARLEEGFTEENLKQVIDIKYNDENFNKKYFRPTTLFNSEKFDGYLNEKPTKRYT